MLGFLGGLIGPLFNLIKGNKGVIMSEAKEIVETASETIDTSVDNSKIIISEVPKKEDRDGDETCVPDKKWYHLSFFFRGTAFEPPYFYMFVIFLFWCAFCGLKFKYYIIHVDIDVAETFILQFLGVFVGMFWLYNVYNKKDTTK